MTISRWELERVVAGSRLHPTDRHIIQTLLIHSEGATVRIPPQFGPSLSELARETGRHRSTISRRLHVLEQAKWVIRHRPPPETRRYGARTQYELCNPDGNGSEVVAPRDRGSRTARPQSDQIQTGSDHGTDELITIVQDEIEQRSGKRISSRQAARVLGHITEGRTVRSPAAYIRQAIRSEPDLRRFLPSSQPPQFRDGKFIQDEEE
jgi:hypothetical protein